MAIIVNGLLKKYITLFFRSVLLFFTQGTYNPTYFQARSVKGKFA